MDSFYQNEDLIVWMRTAAFPSFRKLYGRILLDENHKLAYKIPGKNISTSKLRRLMSRNMTDLVDDFLRVANPVVKLGFPKGEYFIEIEYSE